MPIALITGAVGIGTQLYGAYESRKARKSAEKQANAENRLAERQLDMMQQNIDQQQQRWDKNFAPIESGIANQLLKGPDLEGAASTAGNEFAGQFDIAQDAQERQLRQYGIRPDSSQFARATEDQAFQRAAGIAGARNQARTTEEDQDFLQRMTFLGQGGGLPGAVSQGIQGMYGARADRASAYAADANAAGQAQGRYLGGALASGINAYGAYQANQQPKGIGINTTSRTSGMNSHNTGIQGTGASQFAFESPTRGIQQELSFSQQ